MTKFPLILIPGLLCSPRLWAAQIEDLSDIASCEVVDHTRHSTVAAITRSILEEAPEHFALAGLSMGGYISFEILRQEPERVKKLALLDTSALADTDEARASREARMADVRANGFEQFVAGDWLAQMVPAAKADDETLKEQISALALEVGEGAFFRQQKAIMSRPDSRPTCETISCPTTIIVGELDDVTPPVRHEEIHELISGSTLQVVPECGHLSTVEKPREISTLLRDWLMN